MGIGRPYMKRVASAESGRDNEQREWKVRSPTRGKQLPMGNSYIPFAHPFSSPKPLFRLLASSTGTWSVSILEAATRAACDETSSSLSDLLVPKLGGAIKK